MMNKIKQNKNIIPVFVLAIMCLYTIFHVLIFEEEHDGIIYTKTFSPENYLAVAAVVLNLFFYFFSRKYFKDVIIITVCAGMIGILSYLPVVFSFVIRFIPCEIISFLTGITYLILNYKTINRKTGGEVVNEKHIPDQKKIEEFKVKFRFKTEEELNKIISEKKYVTEAKLAAESILTDGN